MQRDPDRCFAQALKDGPQWARLSEAQQRAVEGELRDFVLGGVALKVRPRILRQGRRLHEALHAHGLAV